MEDLKKRLKKLSLFGASSRTGAFQGKANVLGSSYDAQQQQQQAGTAAAPARRPPAQSPPQPTRRLPTLTVPPPQQLQQPQPSSSTGAPAGAAATAGPSAASTSQQLQSLPPPQQPQQPQQPPPPPFSASASASSCSSVGVAVAQLADDPGGASAAAVLRLLLTNIAGAPDDPKFRRIRLSNPRIQAAVVEASGGVELLLACGFEIVFEEQPAAPTAAAVEAGGSDGAAAAVVACEGFAVLADGVDLEPLHEALQLLATLAPPPPQPLPQPPPQQQQQQQQQPPPPPRQPRAREWEAARERRTQVLLPTSVERDVPEWFFQRTGQELKAAFVAAVRRRDTDQVLMTRAMRERQQAPAAGRAAAAVVATVRVRFPEGLALQGEFGGGEPVAAVFAWVADCLSDPLHTYDLVLPSRQALEATRAQSVREAGLPPSTTLLFRWTGASAAEMAHVPALRPDLLRAARPAPISY